MLLDDIYCNALLFAHWSSLSKAKPCQFSSVRSLCMHLYFADFSLLLPLVETFCVVTTGPLRTN